MSVRNNLRWKLSVFPERWDPARMEVPELVLLWGLRLGHDGKEEKQGGSRARGHRDPGQPATAEYQPADG